MAKLEIVNQPENRRVIVTLSKRNLLALLHKVDWEESGKEIHNNNCWEDGEQCSYPGTMLVLRCEPDAEHYGARLKRDPRAQPGPMIEETETFIAQASPRPFHEYLEARLLAEKALRTPDLEWAHDLVHDLANALRSLAREHEEDSSDLVYPQQDEDQ